jgi:hypothetical protein
MTQTDLTSFPVLIKITDQNNPVFDNAQADGNDIFFTLSDGVTKLNHEIEKYVSATGSEELIAWVKIPSLSSSADIIIYMYYGNSSASNQQNPTGVWDYDSDNDGVSDYRAVWHLKEEQASTGTVGLYLDSTNNNNHGNDYVDDDVSGDTDDKNGQVNGGQEFDGVDDYVVTTTTQPNSSLSVKDRSTVEVWVNARSFPSSSTDFKTVYEIYQPQTENTSADMLHYIYFNYTNNNKPVAFIPYVGEVPFNSAVNLNEWNHLAVTYDKDGGTDNFKTYFNGVLSSQATKTGSMSGSKFEVAIGRCLVHTVDNGGPFDGFIDELRISGIARSADWIKASYNNQKDPATYLSFATEETFFLPNISASPASNDFGSVNVGSSSPPQTFTITNTGTDDLVIGAITLTGTNVNQFSKQDDACSGMTISPSAACTVKVVFNPTSAGALTANLSIPSNDPDTPNLYIVITGTGVIPQYILTVTKVGTGSGTATSVDGLINCGNTCSAIYNAGSTLTLTATPDASSTFAGWSGGGCSGTGNCVITINANTTVTAAFNIKTFTITATVGVGGSISPSGAVVVNYGANQTFTIMPDAGYQVADVVVDGISIGAVTSYTFTNVTADHIVSAAFSEIPNISASPASYNFGSINVSSSSSPQIFTITNTGRAGLVIGTIYLTGTNLDQFVTQNDTCSGMTISPTATCSIEVLFIPTYVGTLTANLSVPSNDPDTPMLNIGLSGTGVVGQCL